MFIFVFVHTSQLFFRLQFHYLRFYLNFNPMLLLIFLSFIHKDEARDESDLSDSDMINGSYGATYEFEVDKLSDSENLESQDIASGTDVR